jgi:hypothetical protein
MYCLVFYVPETSIESVKEALFAKGAGRYEQYDCCAWQVLGEGQFRPLAGSQPFLGKIDEVEKVPEYRVEMICEDAIIFNVVEALIEAHPYEEPAYHVWQVKTIEDLRKND